jgi:hypothetical protein
VTLGKCTILTFVGKTVGNSWPWTDGLAQNTIIAATTVAHASRVSWRTPILQMSTANKKHLIFTGLFLVSAKMTAHLYVARAMRASG